MPSDGTAAQHTAQHVAQQLTELAGHAGTARALIAQVLTERLGPVQVAYDFHREWNGGWRARVEVTGRGRLEFVLFEGPEGAVVALPHPLPDRWRDRVGFAASDGTRWSFDEEGQVICVTPAPQPASEA